MTLSPYRNRALIVVTADIRDAANEDALALDPRGGTFTFSVPLSPTGEEPATHYACSVACTDEQRQQVEQLRAFKYPLNVFVWWYDLDEDADSPARVFAGMGVRPISTAEV
jgi:hypothetical protein